jgi:hypothetical protein
VDSHEVAREACFDGGLHSQREVTNRHLPFETSCQNPTIRRYCHHSESAGSSEHCVSTFVSSVAPCEIILLVVGL